MVNFEKKLQQLREAKNAAQAELEFKVELWTKAPPGRELFAGLPEDREFWTMNDKCWAWHCFLVGASADLITEMVGGHPADFKAWVEAVCAGRERCSYYIGSRGLNWAWTPRKDKMLRLMYEARLPLPEACRLLAFSPAEVKARTQHLRDHGQIT